MTIAASLAFALLLTCQAPPQGSPPSDLLFTYALERSVWLATDATTLDAYLPQGAADAVRGLSCNHAACRRTAARSLATLHPAVARRALILGLWHEDIQVRASSLHLLGQASPCPACSGSGQCRQPHPNAYQWCDACHFSRRCAACSGSGHDPAMRAIEDCTPLH